MSLNGSTRGSTSSTLSSASTGQTQSSSTSLPSQSTAIAASDRIESPSFRGSFASSETSDNVRPAPLHPGDNEIASPLNEYLSSNDDPFAIFGDSNGQTVTVGRSDRDMADRIDDIMGSKE